ncbi:MAG: DUF3971 domain-containing protein [Gammaproteobacteria bacterium]
MSKSGAALKVVNALWLLLIVLLIIVALYVSIGRYVLTLANDHPERLEKLMAQALGQAVSIGKVEGHWHFLSPSLSVRDVVIGRAAPPSTALATEGDEGRLAIGFFHLGLDVFRTLSALEFRLSLLHVRDLSVNVEMDAGRIRRIDGLRPFVSTIVPTSAAESRSKTPENTVANLMPRMLQNILSDKGIIFQNVDLTVSSDDAVQRFHVGQLALLKWDGRYHIQGDVASREDPSAVLSFSSELQGEILHPLSWQGQFQVSLDRVPVSPWLWQRVQQGLEQGLPRDNAPQSTWQSILSGQLKQLEISASLQGDLEEASVSALHGTLALHDLDYRFSASDSNTASMTNESDVSPGVALALLSTRFSWSGTWSKQWRLRLEDSTIRGSETTVNWGPVFASREAPNEDHAAALRVQGQDVAIKPSVAVLLESGVLEPGALESVLLEKGLLEKIRPQMLSHTQPEGWLKRFEFVRHIDASVSEASVPENSVSEANVLDRPTAIANKPKKANKSKKARWEAALELEDVGWSAVEASPGLRGLNATLIFDQSGGVAQVRVENGEIDLQPSFRARTPIDVFSMPVRWFKRDEGVRVESGIALVRNVDTRGAGLFALDIPRARSGDHADSSKPILSLVATLSDGRGESVHGYLPTAHMPPVLVKWLDNSLVNGHLDNGHFLYEGPLARVPYGQKTFQMRFEASDVTVDYFPPWPKVTDAAVDAFVGIREGEFTVKSGRIYDAELDEASIVLPYFERKTAPHLRINAAATGSVRDGVRVLQQSPLREPVAGFIDEVAGTGKLKVALQLTIPLAKGRGRHARGQTIPEDVDAPEDVKAAERREKMEVAAQIQLEKADVSVRPWGLQANSVSGEVHFESNKGLSSSTLTGELFDRPVTAAITTTWRSSGEASNDVRPVTAVQLKGRMTSEALQKWQRLPILSFLSGETDYEATITLYPKSSKQAPELLVSSALVGMVVDLPEPAGKPAEAMRDFRFRWGFSTPHYIDVLSKDAFSLGMRIQDSGLDAVSIHLGSDRFRPAREAGVMIEGVAPTLRLTPWLDFISRYQERAEGEYANETEISATSAETPVTSHGAEPKSFDWLQQLRWVDVRTADVGFDKPALTQATLQLARITDTWRVVVHSAELSGLVTVPLVYLEPDALKRFSLGRTSEGVRQRLNQQPLTVDIGYVVLPETQSTEVSAEVSEGSAIIRPDMLDGPPSVGAIPEQSDLPLADGYRRLPPVNATIRRVLRGEHSRGEWSFQTRLTPLGLNFQNISGTMKGLTFEGQGAWEAQVGGPKTWIKGQATSRQLADALDNLGYPPAIESEDARLEVDLSWPNRPWDYDVLQAEGKLATSINSGTLLNINSTASTVRVIGLLNFEMLTRRMQLDFSDVLNKGMQFNVLSGKFDLGDGLLVTDDLKLRGASAQFDIAGRINLRAHTIDQAMRVTLPVTRNLVLPAAATGGLPAAATAYVIEKALGSQLDKLTTMRFHVTGDWDDPQITTGKRRSSSSQRANR